MAAVEKSDPFDIPTHCIPPGVLYQWCAKTTFGKPNLDYQKFIAAGWRVVPYERHRDIFPRSYADSVGGIQYGGCALMERSTVLSDVSREKELDLACINASSGRMVAVEITLRVRLTDSELKSAKICELTGSQYAARRILMIADESDDLHLVGRDGALSFEKPELPKPTRVARRSWLQGLFNLISVEQ